MLLSGKSDLRRERDLSSWGDALRQVVTTARRTCRRCKGRGLKHQLRYALRRATDSGVLEGLKVIAHDSPECPPHACGVQLVEEGLDDGPFTRGKTILATKARY